MNPYSQLIQNSLPIPVQSFTTYKNHECTRKPKILSPGNQLGDIFTEIAGLVITGASAAIQVYGVTEGLKLQEQQFELEKELALRKSDLEASLVDMQVKLLEIQATGTQEQQGISIDILKARAQLEKEKIQYELDQVKREQERLARERAAEIKLTAEQPSIVTEIVREQLTTIKAVEQTKQAGEKFKQIDYGFWLKAAAIVGGSVFVIKSFK